MFRVTKEIFFCYGHRLLNYAGKCRNLHGHNGKAVITVETPSLDALGMTASRSLRVELYYQLLLRRDLDVGSSRFLQHPAGKRFAIDGKPRR